MVKELYTRDLLLRTVTDKDIDEVARMWNFEKGGISLSKAKKAIRSMQKNHRRNRPGRIVHLCFAVYEKDKARIIGWCGLDGKCSPGKTVIFYLIDEACRNKGYATQCAKELLTHAFETVGLENVHGGCAKENVASYKVMVKAGLVQNGFEENGDPLFYIDKEIYTSLKSASANSISP